MRSAALRVLLSVILAACGLAASAAVARGQALDPIATVTSVVSPILSQTPVVDDPTEPADDATDGSSLLDSLSGTSGSPAAGSDSESTPQAGGGDKAGSSTGPRSARRSEPGTPRTRFDRLPRRYELLLERIEFGRNPEANLARLRALLASATPELRARVVRLVRLEILRLEEGGVTARERRAVRRLRAVLVEARAWSAVSGRTTVLSFTRVSEVGFGPPSRGSDPAPAPHQEAMTQRPEGRAAEEGGGGGGEKALPAFRWPGSALETFLWLALGAVMAGLTLLLAGSPSDWPRNGRGTALAAAPSGVAVVGIVLTGIAIGVLAALLPLLF
jgi:hypothetical protein